ncbi:hypothetical protein GE061_014529 [Apolygus lucorum]|uniref:Peptidase C1A papain C-terminal domain-containing protein n=1 Tax=Apolygus lucorum TaxID=248454 RepID=A0A8S9XJM4_APOLU|nr:hypothetical protein GE061_014529 [Apolygus lucorum]
MSKVFKDYIPSDPGLEIWELPKDVKCRAAGVDIAQYMTYLLATYLALPANEAFYELFVNNTEDMQGMISVNTSEVSIPQKTRAEKLYFLEEILDGLPKSWDWRKQGAVTRVRDQGICLGGSWAFAVVSVMESAYFLKSRKLVNMSEQSLIDCSWDFGNSGCFSGSPESAMEWIKHNGGLPLAAEYGTFQQGHGYCVASKCKPTAPIKGFVRVQPTSSAVKSALVQHGPLVAGIFAPYDLRYYTSADGVYMSAQEAQQPLFVTLIGYGSFNDEPYWLIKNSWSSNWGIDGYGMISSKHNMLKMLDAVYYVEM